MTFTLPPDFNLILRTTSLMGSRAKLADVPKLHELITNQVRHVHLLFGDELTMWDHGRYGEF